MTLKDLLSGSVGKNNMDRKVFSLLVTFITILAILLVTGIFFPSAVKIILNVLWVVLLAAVITFFSLGILVIFGMRREASRILDLLLEGALTFMDFLDFLKNVWRRFVELVKEFLIFAAPFFGYIIAFIVYVLLLVLYKWVGRTNDLTIMTIGITAVAMLAFGFVSKPRFNLPTEITWKQKFKDKFRLGFIDGFEVVLFIFFLTMDSTKIFFLPENLNVALKAQFGQYDLMLRSIVVDEHIKYTIGLVVTTVVLEVFRNILRIYANARKYYLNYSMELEVHSQKKSSMEVLKQALRYSFAESKPDLMRFVTFNTVLFSVFLLFPRLKLLTLSVASVTNLCMDLIVRTRLVSKRSTDLISRILQKVFKV